MSMKRIDITVWWPASNGLYEVEKFQNVRSWDTYGYSGALSFFEESGQGRVIHGIPWEVVTVPEKPRAEEGKVDKGIEAK